MKKETIIVKCVGWYKSELIKDLLPELKKEHDRWLNGGFVKNGKLGGKKVREFQSFIEYLNAKYNTKGKN